MSDAAVLTARGEATRQRIVSAATAEFARHGLVGARVDRIVATARTNKAQLYAYFGNKEQLFDHIFETSLQRILSVRPKDAEDLAEWAVRLYDQGLQEPELIRIATWHRLERRPSGDLVDDIHRLDGPQRTGIEEAQRAGRIIGAEPADVVALVVAMAMTWSPVSNVYAASTDEDPRAHDARRALLRRAVAAAVSAE